MDGGVGLGGDLGALEEGGLDVEELVVGAVGDGLDEVIGNRSVFAHVISRERERERVQQYRGVWST